MADILKTAIQIQIKQPRWEKTTIGKRKTYNTAALMKLLYKLLQGRCLSGVSALIHLLKAWATLWGSSLQRLQNQFLCVLSAAPWASQVYYMTKSHYELTPILLHWLFSAVVSNLGQFVPPSYIPGSWSLLLVRGGAGFFLSFFPVTQELLVAESGDGVGSTTHCLD